VRRVPQLRPSVLDLLAVLHPEALPVGRVGRGEVALQRDLLPGVLRRQDGLVRGADLWFWNTETVRTGSQGAGLRHSGASSWCGSWRLFIYDVCGRVSMERTHKVHTTNKQQDIMWDLKSNMHLESEKEVINIMSTNKTSLMLREKNICRAGQRLPSGTTLPFKSLGSLRNVFIFQRIALFFQ